MYKILLAGYLLILAIMPNTDAKINLENNIRAKINKELVTEMMVNPDRKVSTTEYVDDFQALTPGAEAVYFVDVRSGQVLLDKNSTERLPMASTTKLMTALVVLEKMDLNEVVTVPRVNTRFGDSVVGLTTGDRLTVHDLLHGLLMSSGSDAALALAEHTSTTEEDFVAIMNEKATILGLNNTQFTNPVGWDGIGHYSTARDLSILTRVALSNPTIKEIVAKKSARIDTLSGRKYILTNTNLLLNGQFLGAKTGTTYAAGECLASYYKDDEKEIIGVVLNSQSRFIETKNIVDWASKNFNYFAEGKQ